MFLRNQVRARRAPGTRASHFVRSSPNSQRVRIEPLESRWLLAADIQFQSFSASGGNLAVSYDVLNEAVAAFDIGIYTSPDGSSLGTLLTTKRVTASSDRSVGNGHSVSFQPTFTDPGTDYYPIAKLDSSSEVAESTEGNNQGAFSGGVFQGVGGVVHTFGSNSADTVTVAVGSTLGVTLNGLTSTFTPGSVTAIYVRLHSGNDSLTFSGSVSVPVVAFGGSGSDTLYGSTGADSLFGGSGDDWLYGEGGIDTLRGEAGDDQLVGGAGSDSYIFAGSASLGSDMITEASNTDSDLLDFSGLSSGATVNLGATTTQTVSASLLSLTLSSSTGIESVTGSNFADSITGNARANTLTGGSGSDVIHGDLGDDSVEGGDGADQLYGDDGADSLNGGTGDDALYGGLGNDNAYGGYGSDNISGGYGNDTINGGDGNDSLSGNEGNDNLYGGLGNDSLNGGSGTNVLTGGAGIDTINTSSGYGDTVNDAPTISLSYSLGQGGVVIFSGSVQDDGGFENLTITLGGILAGQSVTINADGTFTLVLELPNGTHGMATASVTDEEGLSDEAEDFVDI